MAGRPKLSVPPHRTEWKDLKLKNLLVSTEAQRTVDEKHWMEIAEEFDLAVAGALTVSYRDGKHWIVDGQHRRLAAQHCGIETMRCQVHYDLSLEDEAALFSLKNTFKKIPTLQDFKVRLLAGDPVCVTVSAVLERHNLKMTGAGVNSVGAVRQVMDIVENYGEETLDAALEVADRAWKRSKHSWDGVVLTGLGVLIGNHPDINLANLIKRIDTTSARQWRTEIDARTKNGGGSGSRPMAAYKVFLEEYNMGPRTKQLVPFFAK